MRGDTVKFYHIGYEHAFRGIVLMEYNNTESCQIVYLKPPQRWTNNLVVPNVEVYMTRMVLTEKIIKDVQYLH